MSLERFAFFDLALLRQGVVMRLAGAVDTLLLDAVRAGGGRKVRAIAPAATFIALSPFVGAATATEVANDIGQPRRRA